MYMYMYLSYLVKLSPPTLVPDTNLSSVAEKGLTARGVIAHYDCVVERGEPLHISVIRRGTIGEQDLGPGEEGGNK